MARLKRRAGGVALVLAVFAGLAVTRDVRVAESQVSGTTAALSFRDAAASFWSPSGAATGSWQTLVDGNLPIGNQAAYVNTTAGDSDHLSRHPRITLRSPANFSYEVQARTDGSAWMGLSFHHAAGGDRYVFRVQSGTSNWQLLETTGGSTSTLASGTLELEGQPGGGCGGGGGSVTVPTGEYITLAVKRSSSSPSTIDVYYEGELQASVNDGSPRSGGQVGVYSRGQPVYFHAPAVVGDLDASVRLVVDTTSVEGSIADEFWGSSISLFGKLNGISDTIADETLFDQSIAKWLDYVDQMTASSSMFPTQIRYPSGYEGHGNFWNQAIGPVAGRRPDGLDQLFGNNPTKAVIGTDEAAALAFEMGGNLNLLANADTAVSVLDGAQNADPVLAAALAADWVEYTNSPANGSNPNGGTDWAAVRAANGHFEPFGVDVWEIGNEVPFVKNGSSFLAGRENYRQRVIRFSDAMLGVDPGLTLGAQDDLFYFPGVPAEWYSVMNDPSVSGKFDFWISHIYGPSLTEAGIVSGDVALAAPRNFPSTGTYTFTLRAALEDGGTTDYPTLFLTVDGANVFSTQVDQPLAGPGGGGEFLYQFPTYQAQVNVTAGTHQVGIRIPDATPSNRVLIESVIEVNGQRANPVNLAKDPRFYQMIMGTADAVRTFFGTLRDTYYNGKPGYVTEWNTIWGQRGRPVDLSGMIANAGVVAEFLRFGTPMANFFSLYGEGPTFFGAFDGVDFDSVNQVGIGQDATPRPSAYLLEVGRRFMKGDLVETQVSPFGFFANADDGLVPANRPGALREIPNWVRATSALSPSGNRLTVMVINRHPTRDLPIDLDLGSYVPSAGAEVLLTGPDISANNEPENESGGALEVEPQVSPLAGVGSQFTYTAPRHSVAFLVLDRTDQSPPSAPGGFDASVDGADVDLSWAPSGSGDVVGYHVYRSVTATGPYRGRITSSPVAGTSFTDTTAERGETYRYAVRAIDADGHESELSNVDQVTLPGSPPQTTLASSVSVTAGSAVAGSPAELDEADAVYYDVQVSGGAAEYEATFDLPHTSSTATALAVFVNAHHVAPGSAPRILRLQLRDLNASSWVEVVNTGSTPKGQIDTRLVYGTVSAADLGRFISAGGQLRARVRMQSVGSDILRSDFIGVRSRG